MTHGLRIEDFIRPDDHDRIVTWGRQADIEGNKIDEAWAILVGGSGHCKLNA